jgi:hypothetical protein
MQPMRGSLWLQPDPESQDKRALGISPSGKSLRLEH